ncbi:MAG: polysulfide reductase NrfD [Akkermansia sp.]|nr:polysulfide reductase NrfD [Akkermansia sp.]
MPSPSQPCAPRMSRAPHTACRTAVVLLCALLAAWGLGWSAWRIATEGVGVLGVNNSIPWGWDIANFVFWIGLGHAGTLISAVLLITGKHWRSEIARHAELMTLCAVCTAAVFPLVHVGRAWMLWQMVPLPVASGVWPNLGSALVWDAAAIGSYFLLSVLFWLMGMWGETAPAALRPAWARCCLLMAALLTPLVVTVHSVVGCDFALTQRWHESIIPPYFVCGALLSGMAAVQLIALCRRCSSHVVGKLSHLTLGLSCAMGLLYGLELLRKPALWDNGYALLMGLNIGLPALYWWPGLRNKRPVAALVSLGLLAGMWLERVHIVVGRSLTYSGGSYSPTSVDAAMLLGSIGLFLALYLGISGRMPAERTDPLDHLGAPCTTRPGRLAAAGATLGGTACILWAALTQWADTAGQLTSRPHGWGYWWPAVLVCALLGGGIAVFIHFLRHYRRT